MTTEIAKTAIRLSPSLREFFKKVNFRPIPEEAKYIAFFEDGQSCFLTGIENVGVGLAMPQFMFISATHIDNVEVELDD